MTVRLSHSSFTGTERTEVAVGTVERGVHVGGGARRGAAQHGVGRLVAGLARRGGLGVLGDGLGGALGGLVGGGRRARGGLRGGGLGGLAAAFAGLLGGLRSGLRGAAACAAGRRRPSRAPAGGLRGGCGRGLRAAARERSRCRSTPPTPDPRSRGPCRTAPSSPPRATRWLPGQMTVQPRTGCRTARSGTAPRLFRLFQILFAQGFDQVADKASRTRPQMQGRGSTLRHGVDHIHLVPPVTTRLESSCQAHSTGPHLVGPPLRRPRARPRPAAVRHRLPVGVRPEPRRPERLSRNDAQVTLASHPVQTTTKIHRVFGRLPDARRKAVRRQVGEVVDRWWDAAYLGGTYPRSSFPSAFPGFTDGAEQRARSDKALLTNQTRRPAHRLGDGQAPRGRPSTSWPPASRRAR